MPPNVKDLRCPATDASLLQTPLRLGPNLGTWFTSRHLPDALQRRTMEI